MVPAVRGRAEVPYDYNHGPSVLNVRSQSPVQSLRLTAPYILPGNILPGWSANLALTWANVWGSQPEYVVDYETLETNLSAGYGFGRRFAVWVFFDNRSIFGGGMDQTIETFHNIFGLDQAGRDRFPRNRRVVQRFDPSTGRKMTEYDAADLENSGIGLLAGFTLTQGDHRWPAVNLYGVLRYGLDAPDIFADDHPVDGAIGLGLAKRWSERWYTYLGLNYTLFEDTALVASDPGVEPLELADHTLNGLFALAWQWTPGFALLAQYMVSGPAAKNLPDLNEASHELQVGFKWNTGQYGVFEVALIENIINIDNSADLGLHGAWAFHF
jgi:hypothetical protein